LIACKIYNDRICASKSLNKFAIPSIGYRVYYFKQKKKKKEEKQITDMFDEFVETICYMANSAIILRYIHNSSNKYCHKFETLKYSSVSSVFS